MRDNIHSADLVRAFAAFHASPRPAAVYNIGGGRESNCSMLEAIALCEQIAGRELDWQLDPSRRIGDHRWWISDLGEFRRDYPDWQLALRHRGDPARDLRAERREPGRRPRDEALGRHPGAQRGRVDRETPSRAIASALDAEGIDYEILVVDDASTDATADVGRELARGDNPRVRCHRSHNPPGFGFAVRAGLDVSTGDAVAIVMGDGSD